jgi:hypothetical protein
VKVKIFKRSIIFTILYRFTIVRKTLKYKEKVLHSLKENDKIDSMLNVNKNELIEKYFSILNDSYNNLLQVIETEGMEAAINSLSQDEAINAVEWISELFIPEFERNEDFEKCSTLKNLLDEIKRVKNI